jgi:uncharacterized protein YsxB (DUF464 family)
VIRIVLTFADSGLLETLTSQGHANRTSDLLSEACAGVSILLRTAARLFSHTDGLNAVGSADEPGHLVLSVTDVAVGRLEWYKGAVDMLLLGLRDLAEEYPDSIIIETNLRKR